MRGRREREYEPSSLIEGGLGATIRAWRRFRGLTVTDLAVQAGFGKNGRGYISKIEHSHIKHLGEEHIAAIAQALGIAQNDLQQSHMPDRQESQRPDKATIDEAIVGCKAWLRVYHQHDKRLDRARISFKLAELCWERTTLTERREECTAFLTDALHSLDQALSVFREEAPGSYAEAQRLRSQIEKEVYTHDLDDAIAGCNVLFKVYHQEEQPLDWARTHTRLAQLYWDRARQAIQTEERTSWLEKALQSIDLALPIFRTHAPVSYTEAKRLRLDVEGAKEEARY